MNNIIQDTRLINVNSKDAAIINNGQKISDVLFRFKGILKPEDDVLYTTAGVLNAQFPVSFYNVNVNNQILNYSVNGTSYSLTIPEGNYDSNSFISAFQSQFSTGGHGRTVSLSISSLTGRLTITVSGYTLLLKYSGSTLFYVLGLATTSNYTVTTNILCPYPTNFLGVKKILICSNALAPYFAIDSNLGGHINLISTMSNNEPPFGQISYQNQVGSYQLIKSSLINEIDVQIRDENYALIDFNGIDWSITFQINIFRQVRFENKVLKVPEIQIGAPLSSNLAQDTILADPPDLEKVNTIDENPPDNQEISDYDILKYDDKK